MKNVGTRLIIIAIAAIVATCIAGYNISTYTREKTHVLSTNPMISQVDNSSETPISEDDSIRNTLSKWEHYYEITIIYQNAQSDQWIVRAAGPPWMDVKDNVAVLMIKDSVDSQPYIIGSNVNNFTIDKTINK